MEDQLDPGRRLAVLEDPPVVVADGILLRVVL
jgi:hypothetical protein